MTFKVIWGQRQSQEMTSVACRDYFLVDVFRQQNLLSIFYVQFALIICTGDLLHSYWQTGYHITPEPQCSLAHTVKKFVQGNNSQAVIYTKTGISHKRGTLHKWWVNGRMRAPDGMRCWLSTRAVINRCINRLDHHQMWACSWRQTDSWHDTESIYQLPAREPEDPTRWWGVARNLATFAHNARHAYYYSRIPQHRLKHNTCTVLTARRHASALYAIVVCVSITRRYCVKTAKRTIKQTMPRDSPGKRLSFLTP